MERDACIAHGTALFLKERFMHCSDEYTIHVCDICGFMASKMKKSDNFWCRKCNNFLKISKVAVPYSFKLMVQEMASVNIGMLLRTTNYENL